MNWLFKEEPSNYNYDALVRDGKTSWTGVRNPVAQRNLRSIKKGDKIFFYHTGNEKVGDRHLPRRGDAYPDPADKTGKLFAVDVEPVKKLKSPVTLASIKADKRFADFRPDARSAAVGDAGVRREWKMIVEMGALKTELTSSRGQASTAAANPSGGQSTADGGSVMRTESG